jgi:hypothetical protein
MHSKEQMRKKEDAREESMKHMGMNVVGEAAKDLYSGMAASRGILEGKNPISTFKDTRDSMSDENMEKMKK